MSKSYQQQTEELRLAWHDLWFEIFMALRIPTLARWLGHNEERQWVKDARARRRHT